MHSTAETSLSSVNEPPREHTDRIEHYADVIVGGTDYPDSKHELPSCLLARVIGNFASYSGTSFYSHSVFIFNAEELPTSMVSHVNYCNVSVTQTPPKELYKVDLWQHLINIKNCSFVKAAKRKQDLDSEGALCESFESMALAT